MSRLGDTLTAASHAANLAQGALTWRDKRRSPERLRAAAISKAARLRRKATRRKGWRSIPRWARTPATLLAEAADLDAEAQRWDAVIRGDSVST